MKIARSRSRTTKPFGSPDGFAMKSAVISSTSVFDGFGYANHSQSFFPRKRGIVSAPSLSRWVSRMSITFVAGGRSAPVASTTPRSAGPRSEEHTSELQSHVNLVCRLLLEKKKHSTDGESSRILTRTEL